MSELSELLKRTREEQGLSLRQVAAIVPRGPSTIANWEKGHTEPNWDDCGWLAKAYSLDAQMLRELRGFEGVERYDSGPPGRADLIAIWDELAEPRREQLTAVGRALRDQQRAQARERRHR